MDQNISLADEILNPRKAIKSELDNVANEFPSSYKHADLSNPDDYNKYNIVNKQNKPSCTSKIYDPLRRFQARVEKMCCVVNTDSKRKLFCEFVFFHNHNFILQLCFKHGNFKMTRPEKVVNILLILTKIILQ